MCVVGHVDGFGDGVLQQRIDTQRGLLVEEGVAPGLVQVFDDRHRLVALLDYLLANADGQKLIFPIHPRTREAVARYGLSLEGFQTLPPIGYLDMARLVSDASVVYTDSGGLQKEAYFHRTPCVTLRSETEWVETVEAGWNRLWQVPKFRPRREIEEYGDGQAAERIVSLLHGYDNQ